MVARQSRTQLLRLFLLERASGFVTVAARSDARWTKDYGVPCRARGAVFAWLRTSFLVGYARVLQTLASLFTRALATPQKDGVESIRAYF